MSQAFVQGAREAFAGLGLMWRPGLRRYVLIPLLINLLLFGAGTVYAALSFEHWMNHLLPEALAWARWLLWPLFALTLLLVLFFGFTMLANLIAAPFNALLSQRLEEQLRGQRLLNADPPLPILIARTVWVELRKLGYFLLRALPLLLLFLIPGVNLLAPLLWFLFGAWMMALQYMDHPMGNHGIGFDEQRRQLKSQRLRALGFGSAVNLMTLVPGLNLLSMPAAVCGATRLWVRHFAPDPASPGTDQGAKRRCNTIQ
ncbi:MAG: sulfate transporter CysZ [Halothiobacillaceae bacterium]|jgi:CysZ protein|nr:sulfate transporter CysZ [Halothiobacillaceae bacterium]MDY0049120.1 sulfate transporter CysZ [Halothiobacillaceae bacterium]